MIDCPMCGCKDFGLEWAGPHVKATCKSCGEPYRPRKTAIQFIEQGNLDGIENEERATEAQVKYLKVLVSYNADKLPKSYAGEVISLLKKLAEV